MMKGSGISLTSTEHYGLNRSWESRQGLDKKSMSYTRDIVKKPPKPTNNCGLAYILLLSRVTTQTQKNLGNPKIHFSHLSLSTGTFSTKLLLWYFGKRNKCRIIFPKKYCFCVCFGLESALLPLSDGDSVSSSLTATTA